MPLRHWNNAWVRHWLRRIASALHNVWPPTRSTRPRALASCGRPQPDENQPSDGEEDAQPIWPWENKFGEEDEEDEAHH